jgi:hypothetical protein
MISIGAWGILAFGLSNRALAETLGWEPDRKPSTHSSYTENSAVRTNEQAEIKQDQE